MFTKLKPWLTPPAFADEEQTQSAGILNTITLISMGAALLYSLITVALAHATLASLSLLGVILLGALISQILMRLGYIRIAGWVFLSLFWIIITLTILFTGGIVAPGHVVYLTVIAVASLVLGIRGGLIFTLLSGAAGFTFLLLQLRGNLPEPLLSYDPVSQWVVYTINMLMLAFSVLVGVQKLYQSLGRIVAELTERKRVEAARVEAESRYRVLVEQVPAIVYTAEFGQSGHWNYVSPQINEVLGFSVEEWKQDPELWYKQLHPEDKERVISEEGRSRKTGEALRSEYRLIDRNGKETWFLDEARVIRDSTGRSLFLQGVMYNITERKGVEVKLAQSESKYRQLANLLPQIVFEADLSGRITFANQTAFDAFGYDQDEFERGLNTLQMIVPGDRQRAADNMQRILQGGKPVDPEYTAIAKEGRTFPILIFSAPVYDGHQVIGTRGIIVDISDRKHVENELRNSEERFRSAFDNAPIGMALIGLDDQILQVNQALCDILGYAREQLVNKTSSDISYPGDRALELRSRAELLAGGNESFTLEKRYVHADGRIVWGQLSVSLVTDKDNAPLYYLGQLQDISRRKDAEETLRASEQRYQQLYSEAKQQTRELLLLHRVRTAIAGELELDSVIRAVVEAVAETFGYTLVSLYLREDDRLRLHSQVGYDENVIRIIPMDKGVCGRVARTRKAVLITDVNADPAFLGAIENITSEVCTPLFDRGEVAGVLNIESINNVLLTEVDLQLMTALSEYVSLAIERGRLYTETRENEERFRALLENSTDIISVFDVQGRIIYSSPSIQRIMGYAQRDYLNTNLFDKIHADDQEWVKALFSNLIVTPEKNFLSELRFLHQDGSWRWIELTARNALDDPNVGGVIANYRDITDRRISQRVIHARAAHQSVLAEIGQRALIENNPSTLMAQIADLVAETLEVEFCKILELMPDGRTMLLRAGVGWKDGSVGQVIVDAGAKSQAGYTLMSRTPVVVEDLQTERRFTGPKLLIEHGITSGMSVIIEGRDRPYGILGVHSRAHRIFEQDDVYFLQAIANILGAAVGRAQADEALRSSEERYMLVATGANDGLWDWNLETGEIYYSPRWKEMLGFSEEEIAFKIEEWFDRVHPDDHERVTLALSPNLNREAFRFELEYRIQHKDGSYRWVLNRGIILRRKKGEAYRIAGSLTDITKRKDAEQQLQFDAFHDPLTGLSNRAFLLERLAHVIKYGERKRGYHFAVLFLDLDEFKIVNDRFGHSVGDMLLKAVAQRLEGMLRSIDTLTRLGGDEFVILLEDINNLQESLLVAERVKEKLSDPFDLEEVKLSTTASIGIVWNEHRYERPDEVLRDADIAMYRAKGSGKAHYYVFSQDMREQTVRRLERELDLRHALERRQLHVFYQPIFSFQSRRPIGVEALVRWKHPTQGLVMPVDFIKIAEDSNLIIPIDHFVLRETCKLMREWEMAFPEVASWTVNVNLSSRHFMQSNLVDAIQLIVQDTHFDPARVTLEITESVIMENVELAMKTTQKLHDLGIQIGLDDFGTGYSSLSYLTRFPVDILKLDQSFVPRILTDRNTREIVDTVVKLAKKLGMKVVAEGVETDAQLSELQALGCEFGQGYLFSKPLDQDAMRALILK